MTEHINALYLRLSNERLRVASAKSVQEIQLRKVWVSQIEKEIAGELKFSGSDEARITDDELLAELGF